MAEHTLADRLSNRAAQIRSPHDLGYYGGIDATLDLEAANELDRLRSQNAAMLAALRMGVQLAESGGHGEGKSCPTCHFLRAARDAIGEEKADGR